MTLSPYLEMFGALSDLPGLVHGFLLRHPGIDVDADRETALARLGGFHREELARLGVSPEHLATGEQVHGSELAEVDGPVPSRHHVAGVDGLLTATAGQFLGVYVADCGPVLIADPVRRACAAVHSGKKGTELGIVSRAIARLKERYGSDPADLVVQLGPCIRPPAYEIDFAAAILAACREAGVPGTRIHDCGTCTSVDSGRYYSYRIEKGRTGRHFAFIGWSAAQAAEAR